jgi:hypothetical protein
MHKYVVPDAFEVPLHRDCCGLYVALLHSVVDGAMFAERSGDSSADAGNGGTFWNQRLAERVDQFL